MMTFSPPTLCIKSLGVYLIGNGLNGALFFAPLDLLRWARTAPLLPRDRGGWSSCICESILLIIVSCFILW